MKKIIVSFIAGAFASMSYGATMSVNGPINSTNNWGNKLLTLNENYTLRATGTVSSADNFTLMGASTNVFIVADGAAAATVNMNGGTFNVAGKLYVGHSASAKGILNLSGGTLATGGDFGIASFRDLATADANISGGTLNVGGNLLIGKSASGVGSSTGLLKYTGGSIGVAGQFQIRAGSKLQFQLGSGPIAVTGQRGGDATGLVELLFGGGYSHVAGVTNVLVSSGSAVAGGTYTLVTDGGNMSMTNGAMVKINGYDFSVINTANTLGLVVIPEPATLGLFVVSAAGLLAARRMVHK
jgi:hypothetical protein